jgi:hypothetical protein
MSAAPTPALLRPPVQTLRTAGSQANLQRVDLVRITGHLAEHGAIRYSAGSAPRAWLVLEIKPPRGLPYQVQQDLGTDPTDHMLAESRAAGLRRGALVSATGEWLRLRTDHGAAVLVLEGCRNVITHTLATTADQIQESDPCTPKP